MGWFDWIRPKKVQEQLDEMENLSNIEDVTLPDDEVTIHTEGESEKSSKPWVEIKGSYDPEYGMKFETNWNTPFVEELRKHGYTGTEEQIMQQYLLVTYKNILDGEEQENPSFE